MNTKKPNKKMYTYFFIAFGVMITILIIIMIINFLSGGKISYATLESKMKTATIAYFASRESELPKVGETINVDYNTLVKAEKIKPIEDLLKEDSTSCTTDISVSNNNGHYLYSAKLSCKEKYGKTFLYNQVINDNLVVGTGDGLYQVGNEYIFRGENIDNYVSFANKTWRIIKINEDNSLRLINITGSKKTVWDNRYNNEVNSGTGINNYRVSRIKDAVEELYNSDDVFSDDDRKYIVSQNVCLDKLSSNSYIDKNNSCNDVLSNQYISVINLKEFVIASIDKDCNSIDDAECSNYNYLANFDRSLWTITGSQEKTNLVFQLSPNPYAYKASMSSSIKEVIHLSNRVLFKSGNGSLENPYKIES